MQPALAFDLNGTLLDLSSLDPLFQREFGEAGVRREWFQTLLHLAITSTLGGAYKDFSALGQAALEMVCARHGKELASQIQAGILKAARNSPPFPDVKPGLQRLRQAGFRLAVLTNSAPEAAEEGLTSGGIRVFFERVLSVDRVRRYKPAPEVYRMAAEQMQVRPDSLMLVAAHSWDTTGAIRAGCQAAFLSRPGQVLEPLGPRPQFIAEDLEKLAPQLVSAFPS